jgi:LacI family transcriptional regulator
MRDIAAELGVSVITVSNALRNRGRISSQVRERVLKRAKELNYHPNLTAQSLATGRTYLVGMIVPDLMHPFFAAIAKELARNLRGKGYSLVISSSGEDTLLELQQVESLLARHIDALVLATCEHSKSSRVFRWLKQANVPCMLLDRPVPGLDSHFVGSDDRAIGKLATEHLIERGYRRIAHIGLSGPSTGSRRLQGYKATMKKYDRRIDSNHVILVESADERGEDCGYTAMQKLLSLEPRPDAVFCYNDIIASGAEKAVLDAGNAIPGDVALIGVSNLAGLCFWSSLRVTLTSVDQDTSQLATLTASAILEMQNRSGRFLPKRVFVPLKLVVRDST